MAFLVIINVLGLYLSLTIFGLCQQQLYSYNSYNSTIFLLLGSFIANTLVAFSVVCVKQGLNGRRIYHHLATLFEFGNLKRMAILAASSVMGKIGGWHSLTLVDYPTQALTKCGRPVSLVVLGYLQHGKIYSFSEYMDAGWILASLIVFNLSKILSHKGTIRNTALGNLLLFMSLLCDGYTGSTQDWYIFARRMDQFDLMFMVNFLSASLCVPLVLLFEGFEGVNWLVAHPAQTPLWILTCVLSAVGMATMYSGLNHMSMLSMALLTTSRKMVTIVITSFLLTAAKALTHTQWLAVFSVFACLCWKTYKKYSKTLLNKSKTDSKKPVSDPVMETTVTNNEEKKVEKVSRMEAWRFLDLLSIQQSVCYYLPVQPKGIRGCA
eukprot:Platyproteum_vivax@DN4703_c0_g1_i1.p1